MMLHLRIIALWIALAVRVVHGAEKTRLRNGKTRRKPTLISAGGQDPITSDDELRISWLVEIEDRMFIEDLSMPPTRPPTNAPTDERVSESFVGLTMDLFGITEFPPETQQQWEDLTANYSTAFVSDKMQDLVANFVTNYTVTDFFIDGIEESESSDRSLAQQSAITVVFDQTVEYNRVGGIDISAENLVKAPFAKKPSRGKYVDDLQNSRDEVLRDVNDVSRIQLPPTPAPTPFPSGAPIRVTTPAPTGAPIRFPTPAPTGEPTPAPTPFPSGAPIRVTTPAPTGAPIRFPTPAPTGEPTPAPTPFPSGAPIRVTTPAPTGEPTPAPTPFPSGAPIRVTTPTPTGAPIRFPTPAPTGEPTPVPTTSPEPTPVPTTSPEPTASLEPTIAAPTPSPTPNSWETIGTGTKIGIVASLVLFGSGIIGSIVLLFKTGDIRHLDDAVSKISSVVSSVTGIVAPAPGGGGPGRTPGLLGDNNCASGQACCPNCCFNCCNQCCVINIDMTAHVVDPNTTNAEQPRNPELSRQRSSGGLAEQITAQVTKHELDPTRPDP